MVLLGLFAMFGALMAFSATATEPSVPTATDDDNKTPDVAEPPASKTEDADTNAAVEKEDEAADEELGARDFDLIQRCKDLEIDREQAEEICEGVPDNKKNDVLRRFVTRLEYERRAAGSRDKSAPRAEQEKPAERKSRKGDITLKAEDFDDPEKVIAVINKLNEHIGVNLDDLDGRTDMLGQNLTGMYNDMLENKTDRFIESLGPDWEPVFGKGPTEDLDENSKEFANRAELLAETLKFAKVGPKPGKRPSFRGFSRSALASAFSDHNQHIERQKLITKRKARDGAHAARPVSQKSAGGTGPDKAMDFIGQFLDEHPHLND